MRNNLVTKYRQLAVLALLFLVAPLAFACTADPDTEEVELQPTPTVTPSGRGAGDTLELLYWEAPSILNPHLSGALKDWEASRITYEPLASFDRNGDLVPFLAAEIPSLENGDVAGDGRSVTWRLKTGVRWSDGEPFTAADVRFTYEYITNPDVGAVSAFTYDAVSDVEIIDDYTVKIHFHDQNPGWSLSFVGTPGMILPKHLFEPYNGPNARQAPGNMMPTGTGPYRVLEFTPQEVLFLGTELIETNKIVFEPNPYFRDPDKPYFSRVVLKGGGTVSEAARQVLAEGLVDYAYALQIPADELARLEANGQGEVLTNFGSTLEMIELNRTHPYRATADGERSSLEFSHPFFDDLRVRQAFSLAIDRERIAALYGLTGQPTSNILVAPANYQSPNTSFEYNPEKAAALLDEAGWIDSDGDGIRDKDGVKMSVLFQTAFTPIREQIQEIIKQELQSLGVEVELKIIDAGIFFSDDVSNANNSLRFLADMQELDILSPSPDPSLYVQWWTCEQIPQRDNDWGGYNSPRWCNPEYDALYQRANSAMEADIREQLFMEMNDMLVEDVVMIPLVHQAQVSGVNRSLVGVELTPWDADTWQIKEWRRSAP